MTLLRRNVKDLVRDTDRFSPRRITSVYSYVSHENENHTFKNIWKAKKYTHKDLEDEILTIKENFNFLIPQSLIYLKHSIVLSSYILDLQEDWDDNGAVPYSEETWKKAVKFVIDFGFWINENFSARYIIPKIYHGPNGSIDILFQHENFKAFFNIAAQGKIGYFYANSKTDHVSEGNFSLTDTKYNLLPLPLEY